MTAPVDLTAVKAMLMHGFADHLEGWRSSDGDLNELAATVAEWFAAHYEQSAGAAE